MTHWTAFPLRDDFTLPQMIYISKPTLVRKIEHELRRQFAYPRWCEILAVAVEIRGYKSRAQAVRARFGDRVGENGRTH